MTSPFFNVPSHGPLTLIRGEEQSRIKLLLLPEAFTSEADFVQRCEEVCNAIESEAWFTDNDGWSAASVWSSMINSTGSGVRLRVPYYWNIPLSSLPEVVFESEYGAEGQDNGLQGGLDASGIVECLKLELIKELDPGGFNRFSHTAVLVNYDRPGGMFDNEITWCAVADNYQGMLLHELGHAFGLDDEYEAPDGYPAAFTGLKYQHLNTTTSGSAPPWTSMLTPGMIQPSHPQAGGCTVTPGVPSASPDFVGAFEGAAGYHCGVYRPALTCRMRDLQQPFCVVCQKIMLWKLFPDRGFPLDY